MKILLDTHIAIWALADTAKLPDDILDILSDSENDVFYSIASVWEIAIKHRIKPAEMPMSEEEFVNLCETIGFKCLSIKHNHIFLLRSLERSPSAKKHNDPFDRMLIAQAKYEDLTFITHDSLLLDYNEKCIKYV